MAIKILFCDIDGTITETISGMPFKQSPNDIKPLPGAQKAIENYAGRGYKIVGISNQGGVDFINPKTQKPYKTIEETVQEMQNTLELFPALSCIYFCPKMDGEYAWYVDRKSNKKVYADFWDGLYRKPDVGMVNHVIWDQNEIVSPESLIVGDRPENMKLAEKAGIRFSNADIWRSRFI